MIINHDFGLTNDQVENTDSNRRSKSPFGYTHGRVLMVGFAGPEAFGNRYQVNDEAQYIAASRFLSLSQADFLCLAPDLVLSPLVTGTYDAVDFASLLHRMRFGGEFHALVKSLPNTSLVEKEVSASCPGLKFSVVTMAAELVPFRR